MGLVEEEAQHRLVGVTDLGEGLEQFAEHPQKEGRVEPRGGHQLVGGEDVDDAATLIVNPEEIVEVERGLAEEMVAALAAQLEQRALDGADRLFGDIAIFEGQLIGAGSDVDQHRLEVVEVEDQQAFLVGDVEGDGQHALLNLVEVHQPGKEQRAHFGDGGTDGVTRLAEQVPELDRIAAILPVGHADLGGARGEDRMVLCGGRAGHGEAGEVALHIGDEGGNADCGQPVDDALQGDGLAGAGRAGD